ncbi:unnamed protein product [Closterium sp. Naga37s-1]|nr:unnamed protein product [Closterium sp. Naga37s-1]
MFTTVVSAPRTSSLLPIFPHPHSSFLLSYFRARTSIPSPLPPVTPPLSPTPASGSSSPSTATSPHPSPRPSPPIPSPVPLLSPTPPPFPQWHPSSPDTGQWLLLALNNHLPAPLAPPFPPSPIHPSLPIQWHPSSTRHGPVAPPRPQQPPSYSPCPVPSLFPSPPPPPSPYSATPPLPDTGQWLLLALNDHLPAPLTALLRARLVEMHDFLMLFMLLAFSVLFNCIPPSGIGLGARYCFTIGLSRLLRFLTFASTILPAVRPWCAVVRFGSTSPRHPHPWAQKYFVPYATDHDMLHQVISTDVAFAPQVHYPPEYQPDWGAFQFLVDFLRPMDARAHHGAAASSGAFSSFVIRPYGGCNDLAFSGHIIVAALTACAWQVSLVVPAAPAHKEGGFWGGA